MSDTSLRLLTVHAHPDDESSKGAATVARYVAEGHDVMVVTCTGGEAGSILNPAMDRPEVLANMTSIRREEMARAAEILGVQHRWLGFIDSGLPEGDPKPPLPEGCFALVDDEKATAPLVAVIREFRPHVVVTYDENGGYPHPDHIKTHVISVAAFDAAGDPERYPDAGEPWTPLKLYYSHGFSRARVLAFHEALLARGMESPYEEWVKNWTTDRPDPERAGHHPRPVRRLVRRAGSGADGARDPDRSDEPVVHRAPRPAAGDLAHRGLRARAQPRRHRGARGRPVRGHRCPGGRNAALSGRPRSLLP